MLSKLVVFFFSAIFLLYSCESKRDVMIEAQRSKVADTVSLGDDIFAAKKALEAAGFKIKYGPDFPTKTRKYLMMIVDYGLFPTGFDTFKYTIGIGGGGKLISGVIRATPDGKITNIE